VSSKIYQGFKAVDGIPQGFPASSSFIFFQFPSVKSIKPLGVLSKALLETDWSTSSAGVNMCSYIIFLYFPCPEVVPQCQFVAVLEKQG
jgi:hypothetical protein